MIEEPYKEDAIANYIQAIDFESNYSIDKIKEDLKLMIGEEPAVKLEWAAEDVINEVSGNKVGRIEKIRSIKVFYTTSAGIKKVEYYV